MVSCQKGLKWAVSLEGGEESGGREGGSGEKGRNEQDGYSPAHRAHNLGGADKP